MWWASSLRIIVVVVVVVVFSSSRNNSSSNLVLPWPEQLCNLSAQACNEATEKITNASSDDKIIDACNVGKNLLRQAMDSKQVAKHKIQAKNVDNNIKSCVDKMVDGFLRNATLDTDGLPAASTE